LDFIDQIQSIEVDEITHERRHKGKPIKNDSTRISINFNFNQSFFALMRADLIFAVMF
jgi:hypothetical protein